MYSKQQCTHECAFNLTNPVKFMLIFSDKSNIKHLIWLNGGHWPPAKSQRQPHTRTNHLIPSCYPSLDHANNDCRRRRHRRQHHPIRSTIFFSQHLSRTINIISIACWIIPLTIMMVWFSSSPCQGKLGGL